MNYWWLVLAWACVAAIILLFISGANKNRDD